MYPDLHQILLLVVMILIQCKSLVSHALCKTTKPQKDFTSDLSDLCPCSDKHLSFFILALGNLCCHCFFLLHCWFSVQLSSSGCSSFVPEVPEICVQLLLCCIYSLERETDRNKSVNQNCLNPCSSNRTFRFSF